MEKNYKVISEKQEELINWLEMRLNDLESFTKYNQLKSELNILKSQEETSKIYSSCKHPLKYQFIDRDGNLRCSDCHKVINKE